MSHFTPNTLSLVLLGIMANSAYTAAQESQTPSPEIETVAVWGAQVKASSLAMDADVAGLIEKRGETGSFAKFYSGEIV